MALIALNPTPSERRPEWGWKLLISCADGGWLTCRVRYPLQPGWNEPLQMHYPLYTNLGEPYARAFEVLLERPNFDSGYYPWVVPVRVQIDPDSILAFGWQRVVGHASRIEAVIAGRIRVPSLVEWRATGVKPADTAVEA